MLRVLEEFLWSLRRDGFTVSTANAIDAARVAALIGFEDRAMFIDALAAVLVDKQKDRAKFEQSFDRFFQEKGTHALDLFGRLREKGFSEVEVNTLRDMLSELERSSGADTLGLRAITGAPGDLDHLLRLTGVRRATASLSSALQVGFFTEQAARALDVPRTASALSGMRRALRDALGDRGEALADALADATVDLRKRIRAHVEKLAPPPIELGTGGRAFFGEGIAGQREMRVAVQRVAEKVRGRESVRRKRAKRGRIDLSRTLRRAESTGGIPIVLVRKRPRKDKPKLLVLVDMSDSVRSASTFLLTFLAEVQKLFKDARSFVFVSDLRETTELFRERGEAGALQQIASGQVISLTSNSNYKRALLTFSELTRKSIDRRSTVVILGDGRTNHTESGSEVIADLKRRSRGVLWICPEPKGAWGSGDSAMQAYARAGAKVIEASTVRALERAAREMVRFH